MDAKKRRKIKYFGPGVPNEKLRHKILYKYAKNVVFPYDDAVMQGFNQIGEHFKFIQKTEFKSEEMKHKYEPAFTSMFSKSDNMKKLFVGLFRASTDCRPYLKEIKKTGYIENNKCLVESYPNEELYAEIIRYLKEKYPDVRIGYTKIPIESVFLSRPVLFEYALVFIQEMQKDKIDKAPFQEAGAEVMRIYAELGAVTNEIASILRAKHLVKCQTIHPAGGDVNLPQLAVKSGLGGFSKSGNVINKEFGSRLRISAILIQNKIFEYTDNDEHRWIQDFCNTCKRCVRECPTGAIYDESINVEKYIEGIGQHKKASDMEKCHSMHRRTVGCSICLRVCPFSSGADAYSKLKNVMKKQN